MRTKRVERDRRMICNECLHPTMFDLLYMDDKPMMGVCRYCKAILGAPDTLPVQIKEALAIYRKEHDTASKDKNLRYLDKFFAKI